MSRDSAQSEEASLPLMTPASVGRAFGPKLAGDVNFEGDTFLPLW